MQITEQYLDDRLDKWARWFDKCQEALGYSSVSPTYNILMGRGGPGAIKALPVNSDAEEIENLLRELNAHFPAAVAIIRDYYLATKNLRVAEIAAAHNLPYREFFRALKHSKDFLKLMLILKQKSKKNNLKLAA